jgi:putative transposase
MTAKNSVMHESLGWLQEQLESASPDLLRAMVASFAQVLMGAEADAICGASYGERSDQRVNSRNGYRMRDWDTRAGTIQLGIPKLRTGSYFPDWLLERRRRAEQALISVHNREVLAHLEALLRFDLFDAAVGIRDLEKWHGSKPLLQSLDPRPRSHPE